MCLIVGPHNGYIRYSGSGTHTLNWPGKFSRPGYLTLTPYGNGNIQLDNDASDNTGGVTIESGAGYVRATSGAGSVWGGLSRSSGTSTLTVGALKNTSTTFSGVLHNRTATYKAALTKIGSGRLTLEGDHTYTGPTAVQAGELQVNGSLAAGSAVTVASGATLSGSGTIGGVVINSGCLAPGSDGGTLTINNALTMTDDAIVECVFSATTNDVVWVNGDLVLGSRTVLRLVKAGLNRPATDREYVVVEYTGADPAGLGTWTVDYGATGWAGGAGAAGHGDETDFWCGLRPAARSY